MDWVPGHMCVEGNEKADEAAKERAERTGIGRCQEHFAWLAHVGRAISQQKWNEAKQWLRTKNERQHLLQRARYDSALEDQGHGETALQKVEHISRR